MSPNLPSSIYYLLFTISYLSISPPFSSYSSSTTFPSLPIPPPPLFKFLFHISPPPSPSFHPNHKNIKLHPTPCYAMRWVQYYKYHTMYITSQHKTPIFPPKSYQFVNGEKSSRSHSPPHKYIEPTQKDKRKEEIEPEGKRNTKTPFKCIDRHTIWMLLNCS